MIRLPPRSTRTDTLCPYTTLFRSADGYTIGVMTIEIATYKALGQSQLSGSKDFTPIALYNIDPGAFYVAADSSFKDARDVVAKLKADRKSTRLNSSH